MIILAILVIDQTLKILIKTHLTLYEQVPVLGRWFNLYFVENRGMAFGLNLPGGYGKLLLSIFRLAAIVAIAVYLRYLVKLKAHTGLLVTLSLILGGALGNMIDSAFYGMIFSASSPAEVATLFPAGGGYDIFMHGKVVDMFYFPVLKGVFPHWVPFVGGQSYVFFRPVFNIADASITVAVITLLFRQKIYFRHLHKLQEKENPDQVAEESR